MASLITEGTEGWIVDTGASVHVTGDINHLHDFEAIKGCDTVVLGDGRTVAITGKGTVYLNMKLENGASTIWKVPNVHYIPEVQRNLFAPGQVTNSLICILEGNQILFKDKNNETIIGSASRKRGELYTLDEASELNYTLTTQENTKLWHRRLGHAGMNSLQKLTKKFMVTGMANNLNTNLKMDCEACIRANLHRVPFPISLQVRTSKPMQILHSDLMGPISPLSMSGKKYILTFTDDFSRYSWVFFITQKSEVHLIFQQFWKYHQERGRRILALQSDGGGEYLTKRFLQFQEEHRIDHLVTAARSPEQNGVAERLNRTMTEKARVMLLEGNLPLSFWAKAVLHLVF